MEVVSNNYMPGDSRLVQQIVYELKSQGIFDQFRKECIADVDTKPAYQNLRQRVEGSVSSFLNEKVWSPDMNKNQVREQLRKSIHESGYLDIGVERIVDQVVNPKINSIFLPQVEDVVYRYLGVQKPMREIKKDLKIDIEDLLPTDLEAVSPESVHSYKNDSKMEDTSELDNSFNKQIDEDESPPFEPLDNEPTLVTTLEENSVDSHLSGFSGLQSHDNSNQGSDTKICQMDISSQDSQTSQNSSESHLSIVTSDETMMEVGDDSRSKLIKSKEAELKTISSYNIQKPDNALTPDNINTSNNMQTVDKAQTLDNIQFSEEIQIENKPCEQLKKIETVKNIDNKPSEQLKKIETVKNIDNTIKSEKKSDKKVHSRKSDEKKTDDKKSNDKKHESKKSDKHTDERRSDEKKSEKRDEKKSKSSDKYTSKDKKDDKYRKSSSKSKDREKSNSRHNSSSSKEKDSSTKDKDSSSLMKDKEQSSKDKTKTKEKKEYRSSSSTKEKGDRERSKDKSDKDKSDKDKNKFDKPRGRSDKDFKDKERPDKDKDKSDKKKEKYDKDKNKTSSSSGTKSSSSSSKDRSASNSKKDKYRSSGSDSKDKVKSTNGDSKSSRSDIKSKGGDSKTSSTDVKSSNAESRSKSSEHSRTEEKQSLTSSSSKKSKKRDSKKQTKDDHYSSKDKKSDRRSTDRDSNDGQSNKQSHSNSLSESTSSSSQKQSNESSSISGSGTNDSGNSDRVEYIKMAETPTNNNEIQKLKYVKPKLASNFQEAIKIMKIRKQLAKLERKNQLSLARIDLLNPVPNGLAADKPTVKENFTKDNHTKDNHIYTNYSDKVDNIDFVETLEEPKSTDIEESTPIRVITPLKTTDLSKENWEALEARLAQEMSNVNCSSYESYDDYDYSGCEVIISPKKKTDTNIGKLLIEETSSSNNNIVSNLADKLEASLEAKHVIESKNNESHDIEVTEIQNTEIESSAQICNTRHNINSMKCDELKIESNDMTIQSPHIPKNGEKSNGTHPQVHEIEEIGLVECIVPNQLEEQTITPSSQLVTELSLDVQDINEYIASDSMCRYLEKPSPSVQRNLQFIYQFVKKLENDVEHCIKASQNNFLPIKRGRKRKCELYVDLKNNNRDFFEEITEVKKRGRPPGLHSNTSISKANKDKTRNSTDISTNETFSLPLSPAESDKSTDKKEDIKPVKQKANQIKTPKPKRQRYSSEDLYKPRPVIRRGRSNRCAKTSD